MVVYGNIADPEANWGSVQAVMSMTASRDDPAVAWRAVDDPVWHRAAYVAIIAGEAVAGVMFVLSGIVMLSRLGGSSTSFQAARSPFAIGFVAALLVWLFGFMVVASEWFQMWRSPLRGAQQTAFIFYGSMLLSAIYIFQDTDGAVRPED